MSLYKTLTDYKNMAKYAAGALVVGGIVVGLMAAAHWFDSAVNLEGRVTDSFHTKSIGHAVDTESCLIKAETAYGNKAVAVIPSGLSNSCPQCRVLCAKLQNGNTVVFEQVGRWAAEGQDAFEITPDRMKIK